MNGTVTLQLWQFYALAVFAGLTGFIFGVCAMLPTGKPEPLRIEFRPQHGPLTPFPVDTEPLILLSEERAALDAHAREVAGMISDAEALIPARWR